MPCAEKKDESSGGNAPDADGILDANENGDGTGGGTFGENGDGKKSPGDNPPANVDCAKID